MGEMAALSSRSTLGKLLLMDAIPGLVHAAPRFSSGTYQEPLQLMAEFAHLAPSTHNAQPWFFTVANGALEIVANRGRSLPICDPHDRELTMSCGAAVQFAWLAARNLGFECAVELLPDRRNPDLFARLRLGGQKGPSWQDQRRFAAIPDRQTNRSTFRAATPAQGRTVERLAAVAAEYGQSLRSISRCTLIDQVAALTARAERIQMADPLFRREFGQWVRPRPSQDGMPMETLGYAGLWSRGLAALIGRINLGRLTARKHEERIRSASWLCLLASPEDDPRSWLECGRALAEILLELTANGLMASFANQAIQVPRLRAELAGIFSEPELPQMLIRVGIGERVEGAPRRDLDELLVVA